MSTKFVACGDSFTVHGQHPSTPKSWVGYLSQLKNWDEINLGEGGASNSYIFNTAIDAVETYDPDVLVTMWTDPFRINLFDISNNLLYSVEDLLRWSEMTHHQKKVSSESKRDLYIEQTGELTNIIAEILKTKAHDVIDAYLKIVNMSLREFWILQQYCKDRYIRFYHCHSIPLVGRYSSLNALLTHFDLPNTKQETMNIIDERVKDLKYYKLLDMSPQWMGYDFAASSYIEQNDWVVDKHNHHPNDYGHQQLSKIIEAFIDGGERPNDNGTTKRPVYIYD